MGPLGPIYTMDEAAAALRMSRRAFQDLIKKHRHYHLNGHKKLFDTADLEALWDAMRADDHPLKGQPPTVEASPSEANLYARARALTERKTRNP